MRPGPTAPSAAPQGVGSPYGREALLRVADQLCAELGFRDDGDAEVPGARSMLRDSGGWGAGILSAQC
jgi:hypothetical protein